MTSTRTQRWTIAITGAALFMVVLDNLIVASTFPAIQRSLHTSLSSLEWVLDAYILAFAVLMLSAAALGERYGRRRVFVAGLVIFTSASAAAALAPTAGALVAARAVQGVGGAVIMPLTLTLLGAAFPPERRSAALGAWSAISGIGVAAGPIAGGVLTSLLSWHWIFWVNVPVGIASAVLAVRYLAAGESRHEPLDPRGLALVSVGLLALVWATVRGGSVGWGAPVTLSALAAGAVLLVAFARYERTIPHAMVPPRLFAEPRFAAANAANFLLSFAMFPSFVVLVQFLADVRHESAVSSGVHTLFWTAMPMLVARPAAALGQRVGADRVAGVGLAVLAMGALGIAVELAPGTPALALAPGLVVIGIGVGLTIPNIMASALAALPDADIGKGSGVLSTSRQVGAVAGVAVGVAIFQGVAGVAPGAAALTDGVRATLLTGAGAAALAVAIGALARRRTGHATVETAVEAALAR